MNKIFEQLARKRGLNKKFIQPEWGELANPRGLPDMEALGERIELAIAKEEGILVFGDYDADGVTAATVMRVGLELAGARVVGVMLPDRFIDGYGMNRRILGRAKELGVSLVVTVDCGSNNAEIIDELFNNGIETIVTDHHEILGRLPRGVVVNPKRKDREVAEDLTDLAGVGVAFMVVCELVQRGLISGGQEKWLLDLVLIGTLCDSMRLSHQNRILTYYGMKVLKKTRRKGLMKLLEGMKVKEINSETVGFQIGPRINAAGRMKSAEVAYEMLNREKVEELVAEVEELNNERKKQQEVAMKEIEERGVAEGAVIVEVGDWHEGVLGIIAGKLVEKYQRPAFVLSGEEVVKGSGRSFGEFNLAEALGATKNLLIGGGGHAGACGLKLERAKVADFRREVNKYYESLRLKEQERFLELEPDLVLEGLSGVEPELVSELGQLEPFGVGNEKPKFLISGVRVIEKRLLGEEGKHLRLTIEDGKGLRLKILGFSVGEEMKEVLVGEKVEVMVEFMLNEWNGVREVEGRLVKLVRLG